MESLFGHVPHGLGLVATTVDAPALTTGRPTQA
jgi:hypothetical protein